MNQLGFDLEEIKKTEESASKKKSKSSFKKKKSSKSTSVKTKPKTQESAPKKKSLDAEAEKHVYSVSELNKGIRSLLEGEFPQFWIQGEISNFKDHSSGHFYFSLKDDKSQINAVMFKGFNSKLKFKPENGMEVLVRARVTVYEPRGNYQIFCEVMQPVGAGALQLAFEQLKKKLKEEGLFSLEKKKKLPTLPQRIAIVTSPTGAAIRDMIHVLNRRYKGAEVLLIPALVQGASAAPSVVLGLQKAQDYSKNHEPIDVIILGRGGGSVEDLWAFNEEVVARAIAECEIPVVSAVGHEVDYTISDFVADMRAPTPSAAAEIVVRNATELLERISGYEQRLLQALRVKYKALKEALKACVARLVDPKRRLQDLSIRCDELIDRLNVSVQRMLHHKKQKVELTKKQLSSPLMVIKRYEEKEQYLSKRLSAAIQSNIESRQSELVRWASMLDTLSPLKVLDRGYSIVKKEKLVIKSIKEIKVGDILGVQLKDGQVEAQVTKRGK